ncbi:MAG: hypothetical protein AAGA68_08055 [Pseudomonadota bacterium]
MAETAPGISIAIATPLAESHQIGFSFADKLLATLEDDPRVYAQLLEGVDNTDQARAIAARAGFHYVLVSELTEKKRRRPRIKKLVNRVTPDRLDMKVSEPLRVGVDYELYRGGEAAGLVFRESIAPPKKGSVELLTALAKDVGHQVTSRLGESVAPDHTEDLLPGFGPRLVVQTSHSWLVSEFVYPPDGKMLATLGSDGVVKLWNVRTGVELNTIVAPLSTGIAFDPRGQRLAALSSTGIVRVFDVRTGTLVRRLTSTKLKSKEADPSGTLGGMTARFEIVYSSDGRYLVHGGKRGVSVWEVATGTLVRPAEEGAAVAAVAMSPDGTLVAAAVGERKVELFEPVGAKSPRTFTAKVGRVTELQFSPDGQTLALGSNNGSVQLYGLDGRMLGKPPVSNVCDKPFEATGVLDTLGDLTANSKVTAAIEGRNQVAGVCDLGQRAKQVLDGGFGALLLGGIRSIALSPDGELLAYGRGDGKVSVLSLLEGGTPLYEVGGIIEEDNSPVDAVGEEGKGGVLAALREASQYAMLNAPVKFSRDGSTLDMVEDFKTVSRWHAREGERVSSLAVSKRDLSFGFPVPLPMGSVPVFGDDDSTLITATLTGGTAVWDLRSGLPPRRVSQVSSFFNYSPVSSDARLLAEVQSKGGSSKVVVSELDSGRVTQEFPLESASRSKPEAAYAAGQFSRSGGLLALFTNEQEQNQFRVVDPLTGAVLLERKDVFSAAFSPDGRRLGMRESPGGFNPFRRGAESRVVVLDTSSWRELFSKSVKGGELGYASNKLVFSGDSGSLAIVEEQSIKVWELASGRMRWELPVGDASLSDFIFRPTSNVLTITTSRSLQHWDLDSDSVRRSTQYTDFWGNLSYSATGRLLALGGAENRIRVFDVDADMELGSVVVPNDEDWLAVTPEGHFDSRWLEDIEEVHWVLSDEPLRSRPLELYMREYYEPQLLPKLVAGESLVAVPPLHNRNRALPVVTIDEAVVIGQGKARIKVSVREASTVVGGREYRSGGAALRLFRDHRLVAYAPAGLGNLDFDAKGNYTQEFQVELPTASVEGASVEFSAYALNSDNVKSVSAKARLALPKARSSGIRRLFVISIGVSDSEHSGLRLKHAANDADLALRGLREAARKSGAFDEAVSVSLVSKVNGAADATKEKVRDALRALSGDARARDRLRGVSGAEGLRRASPDDLVVITYSGHGYADEDGELYLIPSNVGDDSSRSLADLRPQAISSADLTLWLGDVDAGEMLLVVDACYSARVVEQERFKPGPLGSQGLGQLSYDKGMRVLAAAQQDQVAIEADDLEHGLLTYSLIKEGLQEGAADYRPVDGRIVVQEWLQYPVTRVPRLLSDPTTQTGVAGRGVEMAGEEGNDPPTPLPGARVDTIDWRDQQPIVFDFSRLGQGETLVRTGAQAAAASRER